MNKKGFNILSKDFWKLQFLNLTNIKIAIMIIITLLLVIFVPWIVQFILNTLFLFTSFIVFMLIYAIIKIILDFTKKQGTKSILDEIPQ